MFKPRCNRQPDGGVQPVGLFSSGNAIPATFTSTACSPEFVSSSGASESKNSRCRIGSATINYRTEAVAAIKNKLHPFLTSTNIRAIVSQPGRSLDLRDVMDRRQVLIVNLSKGRLGEDNSTLLGALLVTSIQQAAMTRADVPEIERRDFSLYVDEFQNFTTGSFASVLSEARKYRLALIVAHQYLTQLDELTADAVFGNVGSIVTFQVGADDAERIAEQLGKYPGQITPENLTGLPKYTACVRLLINGMPSKPFSMQTLPPPINEIDPERAGIIRRVTQRNFRKSVRLAEVTTSSAGNERRHAQSLGIYCAVTTPQPRNHTDR